MAGTGACRLRKVAVLVALAAMLGLAFGCGGEGTLEAGASADVSDDAGEEGDAADAGGGDVAQECSPDCVHGSCTDGTCECDEGYTGLDCASCAPGWADADGDGICEVFDGTAPSAPTLSSPVDGAAGVALKPTLTWSAVDADYYVLHASTTGDMVLDVQVDEPSYTVAQKLAPNTTYYWRVHGVKNGAAGQWSTIWEFTTGADDVDPDPDPSGDYEDSVAGDRQALVDLYNSTDGDNWADNDGWLSGDPSNGWHGIEVDAAGRVVRLDLFDNGLNGQLPQSLGNLTKVEYFNVKGNELTGPIPASLGNMASLEWLILSGRTYEVGGTLKEPPQNLNYAYHPGKRRSSTNRLSGTIPSELGNLSNLLFLEISDQVDITGPIPPELGNLAKLKGLYLNLNDFSGHTLPSSLGNLTNLVHLYMANSQLEGQLPASFQNLTKLRHINFGKTKNNLPGNNLSGDIPDFSNFTDLRSIIFSSNDFDGVYPTYWNNGNFTELVTLRFTWNNLTGELHGFDNLPNLESFGVTGNNMTGTVDTQIRQLPERIQIFSIGWNNFSGQLPQSGWPDFWQLKTLYLNDNNLSGGIPCDFWNKIDNDRLGIAWVKNNEFTSNCTSAMNSVTGNGDPSIAVGGNNF